MVGTRTVGAAADDHEVDGLMTGLDDRLGDVLRYLALGTARTKELWNLLMYPVDGASGTPQLADLVT